MKKLLLIMLSLLMFISITGCSITKNGKMQSSSEKSLTPEEKYDVALDNLKKNDYTHTVLSESYGTYYSDIVEYKYVVDKDSKLVTSKITSSKYKTSAMSDYSVDSLVGTEETRLSYNDFSTNKSFAYDFQCGSGWNYYERVKGTYTDVDSVYGMIVMMTKDLDGTIEKDTYSFNLTEDKIKEVTGEIFPTKDGNVSVAVRLEKNKVKELVINYTGLYGTGKRTVTFDKIGEQKIVMPEEVKNAKLMSQGQSCN